MDDIKNWLVAARIPSFSFEKYQLLLEQNILIADILSAKESDLTHWQFSPKAIEFLQNDPEQFIEDDLNWQGEHKFILSITSENYPALLREISDPPFILYIQGDVDCLMKPQLGIVGSRTPTRSGSDNAHEFAAALSQAGLGITSGMALGVDGEAHQGALSVNEKTIAVMGTGLDRIYPARHKKLAHQIAEQGALVSEFPIGTGVRPGHFPKRNRIISGLSLGVLVVEAALKSGSLITARLAMEQGREVFAIPGSIHNPLARGCHRLIRDGAKLVETANDIIEELSAMALFSNKMPTTGQSENNDKEKDSIESELDEEQQAIFDAVDYSTTYVDEIVKQTQLSVAVVSGTLLLLEMQGYIVNEKGGYSKSHPK